MAYLHVLTVAIRSDHRSEPLFNKDYALDYFIRMDEHVPNVKRDGLQPGFKQFEVEQKVSGFGR
jgi:hypothetical protein